VRNIYKEVKILIYNRSETGKRKDLFAKYAEQGLKDRKYVVQKQHNTINIVVFVQHNFNRREILVFGPDGGGWGFMCFHYGRQADCSGFPPRRDRQGSGFGL